MKEATYVAISTQKGGAGKTTLTVLVASYLHYVKGYNVAVVDCDFPQYSIHDMRKRDMKAVMEDGHYKVLAYEQLKRLKKNPYPIRCSRAEDAIRTAENLVEAQPDLDFVFFDLPGTINNADVVQTTDAKRQNYTRHTTKSVPSSPCPFWKHTCRTASVSARRQRQNARLYSVPRHSLRTKR